MIRVFRYVLLVTGSISLVLLILVSSRELVEYSKTKEYSTTLCNSINIKTNSVSTKTDDATYNVVKDSKSIEVDYNSLCNRNSDFVGWIHSTEVSLPIVKSADNEYYLSHNFDKEVSKYGSIFLDYRLNTTDDVLMLYGHNAIGGVMFGSLKNYLSKSNREDFYISLESDCYNFKTYSIEECFVIHENDELLQNIPSDINVYKNMLLEHINEPSEKFLNSNKIIILSTCYGQAGTDNRLIVVLTN